MTDRMRINRQQASTPIISNSLLAKSQQVNNIDRSPLTQAPSLSYDLSRVAPFYQAKSNISQPGNVDDRAADKVDRSAMEMGNISPHQETTSQSEHNLEPQLVGTSIAPLVQRDDDDEEPKKPLELKLEPTFLPIDIKDKNNKLITTQSISLELSLSLTPPLTSKVGAVKFSFLKSQVNLALSAAFEKPTGTATDISKSLTGGGSVSIVQVKILGASSFMPGTKIQVGGKIEYEANLDTGAIEPKIEPKLSLKIPILKSAFINLEGTPSGAQGGIIGEF